MYRLLVVEDDVRIAREIQKQTLAWGMDCQIITDFRKVFEDFVKYEPHIVLMDIRLPFFNGYHWCAEIRRVSKVPIIFISSASDNMNIVMALQMGADDFIAKPFDWDVLMAKIHSLLRRAYDFGLSPRVLEHRGAVLNTEDNTLAYNGQKISLTKNEYQILYCLMKNKGKAVSRETLMKALWKTEAFVDENALAVNVARLRKKLEANGLEDFISTRFGIGYSIETDGGNDP